MYPCPKTILSSFIYRHHLSPMTLPLPLHLLDLRKSFYSLPSHFTLFQIQAVSTGQHFLTFNLNPLSSFVEHISALCLSESTAPYPTPSSPPLSGGVKGLQRASSWKQRSATSLPQVFLPCKSRLKPRQVPAYRETETGVSDHQLCIVCFSKCLYSREIFCIHLLQKLENEGGVGRKERQVMLILKPGRLGSL